MTRSKLLTRAALVASVVVPFGVGLALVPLRDDISGANVALILVVVVALLAGTGRPVVAGLGAVSAALAFDLCHTVPYGSFTIADHDDIETAVLLLVVAAVVGQVAAATRRYQQIARDRDGQLRRIHAMAELAVGDPEPSFMVVAVIDELTRLLHLRTCRFEPGPGPEDAPVTWVHHDGEVVHGPFRWGVATMGIPGKEVTLAVRRGEHLLGRFLLEPTPGHTLAPERIRTAVTLADQAVGALGRDQLAR